MHEQVLIKVNAYVDKELAPLIEALSNINSLITFESCQEWFPNKACVLFQYGFDNTDWIKLGNLCFSISEAIRVRVPDCGGIISLEWRGSNDQPWGRLMVAPEYIPDVVKAIETCV